MERVKIFMRIQEIENEVPFNEKTEAIVDLVHQLEMEMGDLMRNSEHYTSGRIENKLERLVLIRKKINLLTNLKINA
jgi:hypothetical protein